MSKRLIVCCDGTWNTPDQTDREAVTPTNVVKMARAIAAQAPDGTPQIVFYHEGVGTGWGVERLTGGAFGAGLSKLIQDAYGFLVHNYQEGDELYFFGFSRGAYAVRSAVGLIRNCGILHKLHADRLLEAYTLYRRDDVDAEPDGREAVAFMRNFARPVRIKFIGVWDTVGALGVPGNILQHLVGDRWEFHDVKLSKIVENAYHALAIDERRGPFKPALWEQPVPVPNQNLEQVWFAGAHCNVGGGYADCGLSDIAFLWMKEKAAACGLAFEQAYLERFIHPNPLGALRDSKNGAFKFTGEYVRPIGGGKNTRESVHPTVLECQKMARNPAYEPENLLAYLRAMAPAKTA
ncbi:MAG TPA: DUF2235 domain-containing protein [Candidatus Tectomicrobia bacterium]|jgi:uncharacterized protein (DUF2235 family)